MSGIGEHFNTYPNVIKAFPKNCRSSTFKSRAYSVPTKVILRTNSLIFVDRIISDIRDLSCDESKIINSPPKNIFDKGYVYNIIKLLTNNEKFS